MPWGTSQGSCTGVSSPPAPAQPHTCRDGAGQPSPPPGSWLSRFFFLRRGSPRSLGGLPGSLPPGVAHGACASRPPLGRHPESSTTPFSYDAGCHHALWPGVCDSFVSAVTGWPLGGASGPHFSFRSKTARGDSLLRSKTARGDSLLRCKPNTPQDTAEGHPRGCHHGPASSTSDPFSHANLEGHHARPRLAWRMA